MTPFSPSKKERCPGDKRPSSGAIAASKRALKFPFVLVGEIAKRTAQVLLALVFEVLHPHAKWLVERALASPPIQNYVKPLLRIAFARLYRPYFAFLRGLSPFWATLSIAVPLAVLEPAKLYATILIAEHPKVGIALWLLFQGLSFILIDRTWVAVRPQSRKIRLVARIHAWGWLMIARGKYWITSSSAYKTAVLWKDDVARRVRLGLYRLSRKRRSLQESR